MVNTNTLWGLEKVSEFAKGVEFWNAEYMKRSFMCHEDYVKYIKMYDEFEKRWRSYLRENHPEHYDRYSEKSVRKWQATFLADLSTNKTFDDEFPFSETFNGFRNIEVLRTLIHFNSVSSTYNYFMDDLLSPIKMDSILEALDSPLPEPPLFHPNGSYSSPLPEDALTVLRLNGRSNSILSCESDSPWNEALRKRFCSPYGSTVQIDGYPFFANVIILGQTFHENFDIDLAIQTVADQLVSAVYESKRITQTPLTEKEEKAVIEMYNRTCIGEYGPTHKAARAIGLWLWDSIRNGTYKTKAAAVRGLRERKLDNEHRASSEKTILRLLANAEACIKEGQALAVKEKPGPKLIRTRSTLKR